MLSGGLERGHCVNENIKDIHNRNEKLLFDCFGFLQCYSGTFIVLFFRFDHFSIVEITRFMFTKKSNYVTLSQLFDYALGIFKRVNRLFGKTALTNILNTKQYVNHGPFIPQIINIIIDFGIFRF